MSSAEPKPNCRYAQCRVRLTLYRDGAQAEELTLEQVPDSLADGELLWAEVQGDDRERIREVAQRLGLSKALLRRMLDGGLHPWIDSDGRQFAAQAISAVHEGELDFRGVPLRLAAGPNVVLTVHPEPLPFIDGLREREGRRSRVGTLTADSFVASLLDWHLDTYFHAASDFERHVERLEESILKDHKAQSVRDLRRLRRGASRLRRMLAPHRTLFSSMARPDFRPDADATSEKHYRHLADHYERAMDVIENAREMVIGSFELFSNQVALETHSTMRVLTFITVIIGCQTVIAGVLGMNFDAPFFATQAMGFWIAVGGMVAVSLIAFALGRMRRWL